MKKEGYLWRDRKRIIFGLPWSFTVYALTEDKLLIEKGILNKTQEEVRLYRIMDLTLNRSLEERIFGLGTIHCCSGDKSTPEFDILRIKDSERVKDLLSETVENCRKKNRIGTREFISDEMDHDEM